MLCRATAHKVGEPSDEVVVFFEALPGCSRSATLALALGGIWRVPFHEVEHDDICTEAQLIQFAIGKDETDDARLFEVRFERGRPVYAEEERTLMLVSPATLRRLVLGQRHARAWAGAMA